MSATDRAKAALPLMCRSLAAAFAVLACGGVLAQAPLPVTDDDLERARRSQPVVTDRDIEQARQSHRVPTEADLARWPTPSIPRLEALPQPASKAPIDLEALAKGFDVQADRPGFGATTGPSLLIFISFSMPEATITRLIDQAVRARGTLLLRGFVNGSLRKTVERMQGLIGKRQMAVQIDPQAFDRFGVVRTPSFVLLRDGAQSQPCSAGMCFGGDQFVLAAGDVSLDYALEYFERSAPGMARDAAAILRRMKGSAR